MKNYSKKFDILAPKYSNNFINFKENFEKFFFNLLQID